MAEAQSSNEEGPEVTRPEGHYQAPLLVVAMWGLVLLGDIARQAGLLALLFATAAVIGFGVCAVVRTFRRSADDPRSIRWIATGIMAIVTTALSGVFVYTNFYEN